MCDVDRIKNLHDAVKLVDYLSENYPVKYATSPSSHTFLFRGESDSEYFLRPSMYREKFGKGDDVRYLIKNEEKSMVEIFAREVEPYMQSVKLDSFLKKLEYARHYDIPTRLLDWTTNPLVALFFACNSSKGKDCSFWILQCRAPNLYSNFILSSNHD